MRMNACARRHSGARRGSRARRGIATVLALAAACALPAAAPAHTARQACAAAAAVPGSTGAAVLRRALRCVVNAERARQGLGPLRADGRLAAAARSHARDMVSRRYFAHERSGWTLPGRLRAAGWTGRTPAEAIAWGCDVRGAPRVVLDGWLASPPHRAIVLGRFTRAGVGLAMGAPLPVDCRGAATWVLDVGR